jgi:A/G-specific adenine glycosylase
VVDQHDGALPDDLGALLALPGVGPYTARALSAFAFERDLGVVDTNTARVLARWAGRRLGPKEVQAAADAAVPPGQGWAWNQAMLDLGATVCVKRTPHCEDCPVRSACAWHTAGCSGPDPAVGTHGVSGRQSRFEGSDRQGRGRLMAALGAGPVPAGRLAVTMGWGDDPARAERVVQAMVEEGLVARAGRRYRLP